MPKVTTPDVQLSQGQPGFMDWLMNLVKEKSDQRDLPFTYGNVLPSESAVADTGSANWRYLLYLKIN